MRKSVLLILSIIVIAIIFAIASGVNVPIQQIAPVQNNMIPIPSDFELNYVAHGIEFNDKGDRMFVLTRNNENVEITIEYFCDDPWKAGSCWEIDCSQWVNWIPKDKLECEQRAQMIHNQERIIDLLVIQNEK
jgi:hypothetical protein